MRQSISHANTVSDSAGEEKGRDTQRTTILWDGRENDIENVIAITHGGLSKDEPPEYERMFEE